MWIRFQRRFGGHAALVLLMVVLGPALIAPAGPPEADSARADDPFLVVLGIAQDGGAPQAGCRGDCCGDRWRDRTQRRRVACLGLVDPRTSQRWLIDATPDFREQLRMLDELAPPSAAAPDLSGILLTHAHVGHYTGLAHLGREAIGARGVPVYAMPRMAGFLATNGPWNQLVDLGNIELRRMEPETPLELNARITVTPILVPHRDEYSETVGFRIDGGRRSVLYLGDVDKWERWERRIEDLIGEVDVAYLDGTFYADGEVPHRSAADIPHPFISESLDRFRTLPARERAKVRFIHLNHTNPALRSGSAARAAIEAAGFRVAEEGERVGL
ncbi:MAG: MBL fold metallo-hydrolase [Planctomycetes bacterium]|nr:MBL fold metallo-hydrolase [Planctomycetota bacterium]